tara:strand:- start:17 stop:655 length:639 start_codon:yes stop_codon:yes gene_type:complete
MRVLILFTMLLASSVWGLSTEAFVGLIPEMVDATNNAFLTLYTVISASFVAFFVFGWSAGIIFRIAGGIIIVALLQSATWNLHRTAKSHQDIQFLWLQEEKCKDSFAREHWKELLSSVGQEEDICESQRGFSKSEIFRDYQDSLQSIGVIDSYIFPSLGGGERYIKFTLNPLSPMGFMIGRPWLGLVTLIAMAIWFFFPSKAFFIRRGWIAE